MESITKAVKTSKGAGKGKIKKAEGKTQELRSVFFNFPNLCSLCIDFGWGWGGRQGS